MSQSSAAENAAEQQGGRQLDAHLQQGYLQQGMELLAANRIAEAVPLLQKGFSIPTARRHSLGSLTDTLMQQHRYDAVRPLLNKLIERHPHDLHWRGQLAHLCIQNGDLVQAARTLRHILTVRPEAAITWSNLGYTLCQLGRLSEAEECCRRALAISPGLPDAAINLSQALIAQSRFADAEQLLGRTLRNAPGSGSGWTNLGIVQLQSGRISAALSSHRKALQLNPRQVEVYCNLAMALQENMQVREAVQAYETALALQLNHRAARSNRLMCMQYLPALGSRTLRRAAQTGAASVLQQPAPLPEPTGMTDLAAPPRPLRIGYLSGDFYRHPVGWFMLDVFRNHNRDRVSIYAYSTGQRRDERSEALQDAADHWHMLTGCSDEEIVEQIRNDQIDVLVDLAGHTAGNRLGVFARRAAKVQVSWLGYFASTGLTEMDCIFLGKDQAPQGSHTWFSEQLVRLEACQFCYSPPDYSPPVAPPPCQSKGCITFGSFNNTSKLNSQVLSVWARILRRTPGSRLILKWKSLADLELCKKISRIFSAEGISEDRLEFRGASSHKEMLKEYGDLDIALDPFPFSGALTTWEALWMGVPVVSFAQLRPVSRQSLAILRHVGLEQCVATTADQYVRIAAELAADSDRLAANRAGLRSRIAAMQHEHAGTLCAELERGYLLVWNARHNAQEKNR